MMLLSTNDGQMYMTSRVGLSGTAAFTRAETSRLQRARGALQRGVVAKSVEAGVRMDP
jgi:hypothetical protein